MIRDLFGALAIIACMAVLTAFVAMHPAERHDAISPDFHLTTRSQ